MFASGTGLGGLPMTTDDHDFRIRPGKSRDSGQGAGRKARSLAGQVRRAAAKAGYTRRGPASGRGTGSRARGRIARLRTGGRSTNRRVVIKARVVRHKGSRFRAAPLARHVVYLDRKSVV